MAKLAFVISLIALVFAVLAYQEAGGVKDLRSRIESLRQDTANGLATLEKALRPSDGAGKSRP